MTLQEILNEISHLRNPNFASKNIQCSLTLVVDSTRGLSKAKEVCEQKYCDSLTLVVDYTGGLSESGEFCEQKYCGSLTLVVDST